MWETVTVVVYIPEYCQGLEDNDHQSENLVYKFLALYVRSVIAAGKPSVDFDEELFSALEDALCLDDETKGLIFDDCLYVIREILEYPSNEDALNFISLHSLIQDVKDVLLVGLSPKMFIYKVGIKL